MVERLFRWGFGDDILCIFCRGCIEGRSHLFFYCNFCRRFLKGNMGKCLIDNPPYEWDAIAECGVLEAECGVLENGRKNT